MRRFRGWAAEEEQPGRRGRRGRRRSRGGTRRRSRRKKKKKEQKGKSQGAPLARSAKVPLTRARLRSKKASARTTNYSPDASRLGWRFGACEKETNRKKKKKMK